MAGGLQQEAGVHQRRRIEPGQRGEVGGGLVGRVIGQPARIFEPRHVRQVGQAGRRREALQEPGANPSP